MILNDISTEQIIGLYGEGMTDRQVAQRLGVSHTACRKRLRHAIILLYRLGTSDRDIAAQSGRSLRQVRTCIEQSLPHQDSQPPLAGLER